MWVVVKVQNTAVSQGTEQLRETSLAVNIPKRKTGGLESCHSLSRARVWLPLSPIAASRACM